MGYVTLIKIFMILMPCELCIIRWYVRAATKHATLTQREYQYALMSQGILFAEIVRGLLILINILPAHPKDVYIWGAEIWILGGLIYEVVKKHIRKSLEKAMLD